MRPHIERLIADSAISFWDRQSIRRPSFVPVSLLGRGFVARLCGLLHWPIAPRMPAIASEAPLRCWRVSEQRETITQRKGEKCDAGNVAGLKAITVSGEGPFHTGALPCQNKKRAKDSRVRERMAAGGLANHFNISALSIILRPE
jgi:hypothetical protein